MNSSLFFKNGDFSRIRDKIQWPEEVSQIVLKYTAFAEITENIRSLCIVGSYANALYKTSSDLDLVFRVNDNRHLLNDHSWLKLGGKIKTIEIEKWGISHSIRVLYASGVEVEHGIVPSYWANIPLDEGTYHSLKNGCIILHEKDDSIEQAVSIIND